MKKFIIPFISLNLLCSLFYLTSFQASAHGYITDPPSRTYKCNKLFNVNCGVESQYTPQGIEGLKGFPNAGPADGSLASRGNKSYKDLDEQSPTRWHKTDVKTGLTTFTWYLTAAHRTTNWQFFITKTGWNQSAPLTRASFDLTPFCYKEDYANAIPLRETPINFQCTIPADRTGYHVIFATWDVADTTNAFYQAIDVNLTK